MQLVVDPAAGRDTTQVNLGMGTWWMVPGRLRLGGFNGNLQEFAELNGMYPLKLGVLPFLKVVEGGSKDFFSPIYSNFAVEVYQW